MWPRRVTRLRSVDLCRSRGSPSSVGPTGRAGVKGHYLWHRPSRRLLSPQAGMVAAWTKTFTLAYLNGKFQQGFLN